MCQPRLSLSLLSVLLLLAATALSAAAFLSSLQNVARVNAPA
jgi:hypothetical protein